MKHRFSTISLSLCALCAAMAVAGPSRANKDGLGARIGADLLIMHDRGHGPFIAGNIPSLELDIPLVGRFIQVELGWNLQWGITMFYLNNFPVLLPSLGLRIYPNGKYLSFFGRGSWGTFLFNDSTLTAEAGFDADIPVGRDDGAFSNITFGAGVFHREVNRAGDFVSGRQWWLTTYGAAIRLGFRVRVLE